MSTTDTQSPTLPQVAESLGITIQSSSPMPGVEKATTKESKDWPHIAYQVTLSHKGREVWSGPYRLGVGHVKYPKKGAFAKIHMTERESSVLKTLQESPNAVWKDASSYEIHASLAAKLAKAQQVTPKLADVLHSLLSDGSPHFDSCSFEEWASEYGYDTDSRKAESIYRECLETGRKLARAFSPSDLEALRQAAQEY